MQLKNMLNIFFAADKTLNAHLLSSQERLVYRKISVFDH